MTEPVKGFQTNEGTKQYDYNALANRPTLITQDQLNAVLKEAKDYTNEEIKKIEIPEDDPIDLSKYATTQWVQEQNYLTSIPSEYITSTELTDAVNSALEQAKANGDFKGEPGDDYILTSSDKNEIADIVLGQIEIPDSPGGGTVDLTGYATEEWVKKQNYLTSIPSNYVTSSELINEVNSALTQAKQNGDFKGDKGDTPVKGKDYFTQTEINQIVSAAASQVLAQFTDVSKVGA